jgi:small GTP-binding protein domain protein
MIVHLSRTYGIDITRHQAGELVRTIALQTGYLMGTVYGIQALSSLLKGLTAGLSTVLTAGAQGGVAYYGSYVIGKAAERYFAQGASWGAGGAKPVIEEILRDLDKDTLIQEAKTSIAQYLGKKS